MDFNPAATMGDDFRRGYRLQTEWGWSMATAFFFGEIGAGLFLVSLLLDSIAGMTLGVLITAVGKTTGHLVHLGQPLRAWRAILRIRRSWVSRGLLAIVLFTGFGAGYILCRADLSLGIVPRSLLPLYAVIAVVGAIFIMLYQGLAMSHSSAIPLWNSGLIPMIGFTYALLSGVSLVLAFGFDTLLAGREQTIAFLKATQFGLLAYGFISVLCLLHAAKYGTKGAAQSAAILLRGSLARWFSPLVLGVGLVLPALVIPFASSALLLQFVAAAVLIGYYAFRIMILKAGVYDPIQSFVP
jgi:formate-dependent nitrite reductase membrane component NrfD